MLKRIALTFSSIFIFALFSAVPAFASNLYLSPAGGSIGQGSIKSVQVRINTGGEAVNGVSAYLSYPADKLEVAWINYSSSFGIAAEGWSGGGSIGISRGNISGVTGDVAVATIGFKGKGLGSAIVAFKGGSAAPRASDSSDSLNLGASGGGTYTVIEASALPTTPPAKLAQIANIKVSEISSRSAVISWSTDVSTDTTIEYGLEKGKYIFSVSDARSTTDHSLKLEGPLLTPGLKINFRVKAQDAQNNAALSDDNSFQLKGYKANITILDQGGRPVSNANTLIYNDPTADPLNGATNSKGEVGFDGLTLGKHLLIVKFEDYDKTSDINIAESSNIDAPQNFTVKLGEVSKNIPVSSSQLPSLIIVVAVALFGLSLLLLRILRKRKQIEGIDDSSVTPPQ